MLIAICSGKGEWAEVRDLSTLSDLRSEPGNLVWVEADISDVTKEDVSVLAEEFDLHPLAVEDALHARQRTKIEAYEHHLFAVLHQLDEIRGRLEAHQIACFMGERYLITLHSGAGRIIGATRSRWASVDERGSKGSADLFHALLDEVVDEYEQITTDLEDQAEAIEDRVLEDPKAPVDHELYTLKQQVARLRRYALPIDSGIDWIIHNQGLFPQETEHLFRDVDDHVKRIADQVRTIDSISNGMLDLTKAEQSATLNEVTKKLSAWAAIFAVGTLIAGIYGMNFELIPRQNSLFGFWFAIIAIALSSVILYLFLRKRKWL